MGDRPTVSRFRRANNTSGATKATSNICTAQVLLAVDGLDVRGLPRPDGAATDRRSGSMALTATLALPD